MTPTIEYLEKYFGIYNAKYFYSILPVPEFELMNTKYLLGQYCPPHKIRISKAYDGVEVFFQNSLIHEMIHYYLNFIGDEDKGWARSHGPNFKREASRINKDGWNIQRCATPEEMSMVTYVMAEKKKPSPHVDVLSVIDNPMDENQLIDFVLKSRRKDRDLIIWLSYPEIQKMVYSELCEDDCTNELQIKRCKAIVKAYQILLDFNRGNYYNLYVLHNDVTHFYSVIGNRQAANFHKKQSLKYEGVDNTSSYKIQGRELTPIKMW